MEMRADLEGGSRSRLYVEDAKGQVREKQGQLERYGKNLADMQAAQTVVRPLFPSFSLFVDVSPLPALTP